MKIYLIAMVASLGGCQAQSDAIPTEESIPTEEVHQAQSATIPTEEEMHQANQYWIAMDWGCKGGNVEDCKYREEAEQRIRQMNIQLCNIARDQDACERLKD